MLNRTSAILNFACGMESNGEYRDRGTHMSDQGLDRGQEHEWEEYIDEKTGILNKEGQNNLNRLYVNNEEFRDEIINFVRNKMELDLEVTLDRRYKTNTLNMTGTKYLTECVASKNNTKDVTEILGKYVGHD